MRQLVESPLFLNKTGVEYEDNAKKIIDHR